MERITVKEAAQELSMNEDVLRRMIAHEKIRIGIPCKNHSRTTYYIYREWLEEYKRGER